MTDLLAGLEGDEPEGELMAGMVTPNTRRVPRYHVATGDWPACGMNGLLCDERIPARRVPSELRCRRRGCWY